MSVLPSPEAMVVVILFAHTAYMLSKTFAWDEQSESLTKARERIIELQAENAKLRELVRDMCVWAYINDQCDLEDEFADRMCELGIEVDE